MDVPRHNDYCLNCAHELKGGYCHRCGQKDLPKRQTLWELIENYIGSTFSFESKFFRTVSWLLFRPGVPAYEYLQGRRERYYHPVRAYAFISLVFFFLLFGTSRTSREKPIFSGMDFQNIWGEVYGRSDLIKYRNLASYDSAQAALAPDKRDGTIGSVLMRTSYRLMDRYKTDGGWAAFQDDLSSEMGNNYPKVLFLMLPLVALMLKVLYLRRDFLYSEHLVFTLYFYNFIFLMASLILLLKLMPWTSLITTAGTWWIFLWLPFAMKRVYRQGWWKTSLKYFLLLLSGLLLLISGSIVNVAYSLVNL